MTSKNDVLTDILLIFRQKSGRGATLPTPPFHQSTFQSVSGHGQRRVRGMAGSQSGLLGQYFSNVLLILLSPTTKILMFYTA
jgi:hypothetical protein